MRKVYVLGACRTPIGKMGGVLSSLLAVDLGAIVIGETLKRTGIDPKDVDHVFMGCVIQAGLGQNVARQACIKAGLPVTTTAETINAVCGSGLDCVNNAARMIQTGDADVVIAGGMESMSNAPYVLKKARFGYRMGNAEMIDSMVNDALWDSFNDYHMGITAENICEEWKISREQLDEFSANSQQKAIIATLEGKFKDEIVPVKIQTKKETIIVDKDESPRADTTSDTLKKLRPAFKADGVVTAGNSSGINDGAAAVILVSENKLKELQINPMAEWLGGAMGGATHRLWELDQLYPQENCLENWI